MDLPAGYYFRPSRFSPALGHAGLDIALTERSPTWRRYVRSAAFMVAASPLARRTIHDRVRKNGGHEEVRVAMGILRLQATNDDLIYGFSFGGRLEIFDRGDFTLCRLESEAPIFEMVGGLDSPDVFFVSQLEAQLARRRAAWLCDEVGYARRILATSPLDLFRASLVTLDRHLRSLTWAGNEYRICERQVRRAVEILKDAGYWPEPVPPLSELV